MNIYSVILLLAAILTGGALMNGLYTALIFVWIGAAAFLIFAYVMENRYPASEETTEAPVAPSNPSACKGPENQEMQAAPVVPSAPPQGKDTTQNSVPAVSAVREKAAPSSAGTSVVNTEKKERPLHKTPGFFFGVTYDEYKDLPNEKRKLVTSIDMTSCDFSHMYLRGLLKEAENLRKIALSDTINDPACHVFCMDDCGSNPSQDTIRDEDGVLCRYGDGNTQAYENRTYLYKDFKDATQHERCFYLGIPEDVRITILPHKASEKSDMDDFIINNGVLKKYTGRESCVTVPDGVRVIGENAFVSTVKVKKYRDALPPMLAEWAWREGETIEYEEEETVACEFLKTVILPDSVTRIKMRAFHKCIHLEKVVFGEKLAGIGWAAFQGCTSLKKVKVPEETTIEDGAFEKTTEIVRVPKNQSASNDAFRTASSAKKCKSLTPDEFERIRSISEDQKKQIEVISINGDNADRMTNLSKLFHKFHGVKKIDISHVDTSFATSMYLMFYECRKLEELNMTGMNTSGVVNMQGVFWMCESLVKLDLSSFDTSHVREMGYMFTSCRNLRDLNLSGFDTSAAENMTCMFSGCAMLNPIDVSRFNTANVTDMSCMFNGCKSLLKLDLTGFDTSKVRSMARMFDSCQSLAELDLSSFNTGNVESMNEMFKNCASLVQLNLSGFDFSNVKDVKNMFSGCVSLKTVVLSDTVLKCRTERKTGRVITRTVPRSEEEMEPVYAYGAQSRSQVYACSDPYKTVMEEEVKTVSLGELSEKEIIESLGLNGDVRLTIVKHQAPVSENR